MENRSVDGYVYMGTAVRYLMDAGTNYRVHGVSRVVENIGELRDLLTLYEFHVTNRVAQDLYDFRDEMLAELSAHADDPDWEASRTLSADESGRLSLQATTLRATMMAEAEGKVAFIASDKRYSVSRLMSGIGSLFATDVFDGLPDLAKFDFEEGGKALAYDLNTAAAFHFLRGTEAVLRDFYTRVVRQQRIARPWLWYPMVQHMRGKRNAPSDLVLDNLDSLRVHFRNPTQHPDKTYDEAEAQDLLSLAIDAINRMAKHLADKHL